MYTQDYSCGKDLISQINYYPTTKDKGREKWWNAWAKGILITANQLLWCRKNNKTGWLMLIKLIAAKEVNYLKMTKRFARILNASNRVKFFMIRFYNFWTKNHITLKMSHSLFSQIIKCLSHKRISPNQANKFWRGYWTFQNTLSSIKMKKLWPRIRINHLMNKFSKI